VTNPAVTIRFANAYDASALATLAQLDSAEQVILPALVAEVDGELRAALSLVDSAVIADPFHPTRELVDLLQIRAQQFAERPRRSLLKRLRTPLRLARVS
jgi:hypothetical protein